MKKFLNILVVLSSLLGGYSCQDNEDIPEKPEEKPEIDLEVSIDEPAKNRDYSFHNNGYYGIFENPSKEKIFKGSVHLKDEITSDIDLTTKWISDIDGLLFEGTVDNRLNSEFSTTLSKGFHKVFFEIYADNFLIQKDSITISNEIELSFNAESGRSIYLNWSKYEGSNFSSYIVYADDKQVANIKDINTLSYEYFEDISLIEKKQFQVIVNLTDNTQDVHGSNLVLAKSGIYLEISSYITKIIRDTKRAKLYAISAPNDNYHPNTYGLFVIDLHKFEIEKQIFSNNKFSDLEISSDGNYLYLTQRYVDEILKMNLNNMSTETFNTPESNGWGFHKIEAGNNILYCHQTPPTSGNSPLYIFDANTGEYINMWDRWYFRHGDIEYNNRNGKLYSGISNTTGGEVYCLSNLTTDLNLDNQYPLSWPGYTFPYPFIFCSEDFKHVYWQEFEFDDNLNLLRTFDSHIIACSPNNKYLSSLGIVYNYDDTSVKFVYPPFPYNEELRTTLFIDDNTIITNRTCRSSITNYPHTSYLFKMKIDY